MKATQKAPVISLPKEAEHFVIHSDVGTPTPAERRGVAAGGSGDGVPADSGGLRRVSVSVRRRRSVERKSSPGDSQRRRSPGKAGPSARFSAVEPPKAPGVNMKQSREGSPSREGSRPETEEVKVKEIVSKNDDLNEVTHQIEEAASPSSLRREIDVLRLQVKTLREVQEQTAELHWKVISNVVEERNFWAAQCKEATAKVLTKDAAVSMTPTPSPAKSETTRFVAVPPFTPSFSRSMDVPKIDLFRPRQQIVTRYTLPSSLCILRTPEGVNTLGRRSPVPQVSLVRAARASAPPVASAATRPEGIGTTASMPGPRSITTAPATAAPMLEEKAKVEPRTLDLSKLPTPCRSVAQAARESVNGEHAKRTVAVPTTSTVTVPTTTGPQGVKEKDSLSTSMPPTLRRCARCGAVEEAL